MDSEARLQLEVIAGPDKGLRASCLDGIVGIGRDPRNDLVLGDARAAGRHGEIWLSDDSCVYVHLHPHGGTSIQHDGRVQQLCEGGRNEAPLADGTKITIGDTIISVRLDQSVAFDKNASGDDEPEKFLGIHVDTQEFLAWSGSLNSWGNEKGPVVVTRLSSLPQVPPDDSETQVVEDTLVFLEPGPKASPDSDAEGPPDSPAASEAAPEPDIDVHLGCRAQQTQLTQQLQLCEQLLRADSFGALVSATLGGVLEVFPQSYCAALFLSTSEGLVPWTVRFAPNARQQAMARVFGRRQVAQSLERAAPVRITRDALDSKLDADLLAGPSQTALLIPLQGRSRPLGVLALAGQNPDAPLGYDDLERFAKLAKSAAVSLERARAEVSRQRLFEAILPLSARLCEAAEPTRAGHCERVAASSLALAEAAQDSLDLTAQALQRIHTAALLHELGRVGVPAKLLAKKHRLDRRSMTAIASRFKLIAARWRAHRQASLLQSLVRQGRGPLPDELERLEREQDNVRSYLEQARRYIEHLARCRKLSAAERVKLEELGSVEIQLGNEGSYRLLETDERAALSQTGGFLSERERTLLARQRRWAVALLSKLPWPASLAGVPQLVAQLSCGTGKPAAQLPPESRVLAVAEGFDELLLTGNTPEQALARLQRRAQKGRLDAGLVELFAQHIRGRLAKATSR